MRAQLPGATHVKGGGVGGVGECKRSLSIENAPAQRHQAVMEALALKGSFSVMRNAPFCTTLWGQCEKGSESVLLGAAGRAGPRLLNCQSGARPHCCCHMLFIMAPLSGDRLRAKDKKTDETFVSTTSTT